MLLLALLALRPAPWPTRPSWASCTSASSPGGLDRSGGHRASGRRGVDAAGSRERAAGLRWPGSVASAVAALIRPPVVVLHFSDASGSTEASSVLRSCSTQVLARVVREDERGDAGDLRRGHRGALADPVDAVRPAPGVDALDLDVVEVDAVGVAGGVGDEPEPDADVRLAGGAHHVHVEVAEGEGPVARVGRAERVQRVPGGGGARARGPSCTRPSGSRPPRA